MNAGVQSRRAWLWVVPWVCFWLAGCATPQIDWAARIGTYTYDQAVLDFGPPDKKARLQDGTIVAEWLVRRGYAQTYIPYGAGPPYWYGYPYYYPAYVTSYAPNYYLRLIFGPDNRLKAWKYFTR